MTHRPTVVPLLLGLMSYAWFLLAANHGATKPNIIFIITDDQDLHLASLDYMPNVHKYFAEQGTFYSKHYCTNAQCCPSRVSLLTGRLPHNTNVTDVQVPYGGYPKFVAEGLNDAYLPVWLQHGGYNTYYTGKLMNAHSTSNWNNPFPKGWTGTNFLVDPGTYVYYNATMQSNQNPPVNFPGEYNTDLVAAAALDLLDEAQEAGQPFFIGVAPIAPHAEFIPSKVPLLFTEPVPAVRHRDLFPNVTVPRTYNFNPDVPSMANWIHRLEQLNASELAEIDHFYRQRLRSLQAVDEMVDSIMKRLDSYGILDSTYVIFTTDNGFHIGQHRMRPGKSCAIEEDVNIPFYIRGPEVPAGKIVDVVTSHTDIAPTFLQLAGMELRSEFDGSPIPVTWKQIQAAESAPHKREHLGVEYWGLAGGESIIGNQGPNGSITTYPNTTYKAMRLIGETYSYMYNVWCTNEHELYDMMADPGQMHNLMSQAATNPNMQLGRPISQLQSRLDALLMVLKSCTTDACRYPWEVLHPKGDVLSLLDALKPKYDSFYASQPKVSFTACGLGYIIGLEGPQNVTSMVYDPNWADWT